MRGGAAGPARRGVRGRVQPEAPMAINITLTPPDMPADEYLRFIVQAGPDNTVYGDWQTVVPMPGGVSQFRGLKGGPRPVREAWDNAKQYLASTMTMTWVYLDDPDNLLSEEERQQLFA